MINFKVLPMVCDPEVLSKPIKYQVIMVIINYYHAVVLKKLILPKYNKSKLIDENMDYSIGGNSKYNIIWGRYFTEEYIILNNSVRMDTENKSLIELPMIYVKISMTYSSQKGLQYIWMHIYTIQPHFMFQFIW